jgi:hypothetical protein
MPATLARTRPRDWWSGAQSLPVVAMTLVLTQVAALSGELLFGGKRPFPEGDQAVIEIHLRQAMRGAHLLGPYSQYDWYHPGPLLYYLLTPLYVVSRSASGSLYITAGLINLLAIGIALASYRKRDRDPLRRGLFELLFAGAVAEFIWDVPPGALVSTPLTEVWNPTVTIIPMLALTIVGAAVASGSLELAPLLMLLHAFVAQTHVSHCVSATVVVVVALALAFRRGGSNRHLRRRWLATGLGTALVLWFPPVLAWLEARHGNIAALAGFALHRHARLPSSEALAYAVGRLEHPLLHLLRLDGHGSASSLIGVGLALAQFAGVVLSQRTAVRESAPFASALALTAWLPVPVALIQATALPSLEPQFYYQSLWYGPVGCLAWYGLSLQASRGLRSSPFDGKWWGRVLAVPATLVVAGIWPTLSRDFERCVARGSEQNGEAVEAVAKSILPALELDVGGKRLAMDAASPDTWGVLASVLLALAKLGVEPPIHPRWRFMFGSGAHYSSDKAPTLDLGFVDREHGAPLWRAHGKLGLYTPAFRAPLAPVPLSVRGERVRGDPARLVSAPEPTEGNAWDAEGSVILLDDSASVTLTLPLARVAAIQIVADGNDSYLVQGSGDGLTFRNLGVVPALPEAGLRRREATLDSSVPLRALRIRPGRGDGAFSLARVELENAAFACALVDASGAAPNAAAVCDGVSPKPNRPRDARGVVRLERAGAQLTLALPSAPGLGFVDGIMLEGDGNDSYAVDGSRDGVLFSRIGVSSPLLPRTGIQHWSFYFNDGSSWSYLRIAPLAGDGFFALSEIRPLLAEGALVDFGTPAARVLLRTGWSEDEQNGAEHWVSALAPAAVLELSLVPQRAYDVSLRVRLPDGLDEPQRIAVEFDGHRVTELELPPGSGRDFWFRIPEAWVEPKNEVRFVLGSGAEHGSDPHGRGVQFRSMMFRPVLDQKG